jgi:hypothetical protein
MKGIVMKYILILISIFIFSCSKEVSSNSNKLTARNPVVEIPDNSNTGVIVLNFANHATVNEPEDELTTTSLNEPLLLTLPFFLNSITFQSAFYKPNLGIEVNGVEVCSYVWTVNAYKMSQNCFSDLDLTPNDIITVKNIPKSQTITLTVSYQR